MNESTAGLDYIINGFIRSRLGIV